MLLRSVPGVVQAGLFTVLSVTWYYLYGIRNFYRDPGSIFFDVERAFDRSYSQFREAEAKAFRDKAFFAISNSNRTDVDPTWKSGSSPTFCAAIVTVGRGDHEAAHPLELTLTSALAGLARPEREDLDLRVYFANVEPTQHPLWNSWLLGLADRVITAKDSSSSSSSSSSSPSQVEELARLEREKLYYWKTSLDFANALENCYESSTAPYVVLLEGDIMVADGWLARAKLGLETIAKTSTEPWLDMRLFNEERSIGWASNMLFGNNVPLIAVGISSLLLGTVLAVQRVTKLRVFACPTLLFLCAVSIPLATVLFFQTGKASALPPRAGVAIQDWGCCTQMLIFPRDQVPRLADYLRQKAATKAADLIILDYVESMKLRRWVLNPVQVQHLGFSSVSSPDRPRDRAVWSVAFEDLQPQRLQRDHARMLAQLYGKDDFLKLHPNV